MKSENQIIAETIFEQLGGRQFKGMTGAHSLVAIDRGLQFKLPGKNFAKDGINFITITLDSWDTYDVSFYRIQGDNQTLISAHEMIYADGLAELFQDKTGLYTKL